jgi:hypothetical protein
MILYRQKNSSLYNNLRTELKNKPYLVVNVILAGIILLIYIYSGIFSPENDNYPVTCLYEKVTGEPCISCGLSHSFSLIIRGRIDQAYRWNVNGMRVFLFFAFQLVLRVAFSIFYLRNQETRRQLIVFDCIGSGLIFLISFWPFIARIFTDVF